MRGGAAHSAHPMTQASFSCDSGTYTAKCSLQYCKVPISRVFVAEVFRPCRNYVKKFLTQFGFTLYFVLSNFTVRLEIKNTQQ